MIPRCKIGRGVSGAVRYALGEGKDPATGRPRSEPKNDQSRVAWIGGTGFGFPIDSPARAELARRVMEFAAQNQTSTTKQCEKDCVHLSLGWRPGEQPTRAQMEEAAHQALKSLGMANACALFVAHNDEHYSHVHVVASKINPDTGRAYDMKGNYLKLSKWAESYERDFSGGIVCTRRVESNQLREAIERRDAAAVLELMVQQRATFTGKQLESVLAKQIKSAFTRAQFAEKILGHPDAVRLSDAAGGQTTRYTTKAVLEAEGEVLRAAAGLARNATHAVGDGMRRAVLSRREFEGISREQALAYRHATGAAGLALIDGQAGTGKSFTIRAIRAAYEAERYRVIGLAPTNAVAEDMRGDGFSRAATIHSELFALKNGRTAWNARTAVIVDEAAMIDTKLMAQLARHAQEAGAKLILVGDDRQLSSIDRGGMFGVLKDRHGAAELTQVRRQGKPDERRAAEMLAEGNFQSALEIYNDKGAIHWTRNQDEARDALVAQWAKDSATAPDKSRFVFAYTNDDVDRLNADLRAVRKQRGELEGDARAFQTKHGRADFAARDRIQFTGTDNKKGLTNGAAGTIERIEGDVIAVRLDGRAGKQVEFDAKEFQDFRHGYAGTIYKGQGRTLDQTYLYHSEHWRSAASYVGLTRHRDSTALFVARNTAEDLKQLSRQMARVDERRAASHFHATGAQEPARTVTANELAANQTQPRPTPRPADAPPSAAALDKTLAGLNNWISQQLDKARQNAPPVAPTSAPTAQQPDKAPPPRGLYSTDQGGLVAQQQAATINLRRVAAEQGRAVPAEAKTATPPAPEKTAQPVASPPAKAPEPTQAPIATPLEPEKTAQHVAPPPALRQPEAEKTASVPRVMPPLFTPPAKAAEPTTDKQQEAGKSQSPPRVAQPAAASRPPEPPTIGATIPAPLPTVAKSPEPEKTASVPRVMPSLFTPPAKAPEPTTDKQQESEKTPSHQSVARSAAATKPPEPLQPEPMRSAVPPPIPAPFAASFTPPLSAPLRDSTATPTPSVSKPESAAPAPADTQAEMTDAKAERLAKLQKMFARKAGDDDSHDHDNSHSPSRGRGGRGRTR